MNRTLFVITGLIILFQVGCDHVKLDGVIGERIDRAQAEAFSGRWLNSDAEVADIRLAKDGMLVIGSMDWDEDLQQHVVRNLKVDIRRLGPAMFALFPQQEGDYEFVRIELTKEDEIIVYFPDPSAFRRAAEGGEIGGEVHVKANGHFDVQLKSTNDLTKQALSTEEIGDFYDNELTGQFRRIKGSESGKNDEPGTTTDWIQAR